MLHQPAKAFVPTPAYPVLSAASPDDVKRAKAWIAGARKCGMVVAPWRVGVGPMADGGVMQTGQDEEGPNNWSAAMDRFMKHPAFLTKGELPEGLVFEVLCEEMGFTPADPDLCDKVNVRMRAEDLERRRAQAEKKLLQLCRRVEPMLHECERVEERFSEATDAFDKVEKPSKPDLGPVPSKFLRMSHADALRELKEVRATPKDQLPTWQLGLLVTGRFKAMVDGLKIYEIELRKLEDQHGLAAARDAAEKISARCRDLVSEIAAIPATSPFGLAAKCSVMKVCRATGWDLDDEFKTLALSIFDDGALCGEMLLPTARPPRSEAGHPAHH